MKRFLLIIWQLPQTLLGLLVLAFVKPEAGIIMHGKLFLFSEKFRGGMSLGEIILFRSRDCKESDMRNHELGHSRQSEILGWFYLPVIGLPSLFHAVYHAIFRYGDYKGYYISVRKVQGLHLCRFRGGSRSASGLRMVDSDLQTSGGGQVRSDKEN